MRYGLKIAAACIVLSAVFLTSEVLAADVENGERLARATCAGCHIVARGGKRSEVADAPPFEFTAGKAGFNAEMLAFLLLQPHPRMNFAISMRDAVDIAAYMSTLAR